MVGGLKALGERLKAKERAETELLSFLKQPVTQSYSTFSCLDCCIASMTLACTRKTHAGAGCVANNKTSKELSVYAKKDGKTTR